MLIRGGSKSIVDEAQRCIHDALCVVRNLIKDSRVVYGGGAVEIDLALTLESYAQTIPTIESHCIKAYAQALEAIPIALAENAGYQAMEHVS